MNFENQSLSVDYIMLNLKNRKENIQKITQFFNSCHCYSCCEKIKFKSKKPYLDFINPRYKFEMVVALNSNSVS